MEGPREDRCRQEQEEGQEEEYIDVRSDSQRTRHVQRAASGQEEGSEGGHETPVSCRQH